MQANVLFAAGKALSREAKVLVGVWFDRVGAAHSPRI